MILGGKKPAVLSLLLLALLVGNVSSTKTPALRQRNDKTDGAAATRINKKKEANVPNKKKTYDLIDKEEEQFWDRYLQSADNSLPPPVEIPCCPVSTDFCAAMNIPCTLGEVVCDASIPEGCW